MVKVERQNNRKRWVAISGDLSTQEEAEKIAENYINKHHNIPVRVLEVILTYQSHILEIHGIKLKDDKNDNNTGKDSHSS